jgi:hypothetical protein
MTTVLILDIILIIIHALIAWVLVEVFVNHAHKLSRRHYVFFHYLSVIAAFAGTFFLYFQQFSKEMDVFFVTAIAMIVMCLLELIVFGYLYSGEKWFLNYVDWIFPMFLAVSTIYLVGTLIT